MGHAPGVTYETALWARGSNVVVGIDEVGRGAWAGPLTVGAVVIPQDRRIYKIRDSKQLTEPEREALIDRVKEWAVAWSVGHVSPAECDTMGMSRAQRLGARRAIEGLDLEVQHALVDGAWDFVGTVNTTTIVKGDAVSLSIAAASIIAKVTRDRIMREAAPHFPWYSFDTNKGYSCPKHRAALELLGPSTIHRRSWANITRLPWATVSGSFRTREPPTLF